MDEPTVLRTARVGGFVKEDVMTYLDELNSKIVALEDELKAAKDGAGDPQEINKYRSQVDNLQEKLNTSNNALRAAKKEVDDLKKAHDDDQKLIAQLKANAGNGQNNAANAQTTAALEAAKKEIDNLRNQLKAAEQKAASGGNAKPDPQAAAALETAKKEIETLRNQLKAAEQKAASAGNAAPAAGAAANAELAKAKQEIERITKELNEKKTALDAANKASAEKDTKLAQLSKDVSLIVKKDEEIERLNREIEDLKENGGSIIPSSFDMGALFTEAQKTAGKITIEAQKNADKVTREANDKADQIVKEATAEAEKTINSANTTAETAIKEANDQAKATIEQANDKAKVTVDEANAHADKVNEMSATVRRMLLNEIESVNTKFNDITSVLSRLTGQANDRMSEAQLIIGEARKSVDSTDSNAVKKAEAPKAEFKAVEAPKSKLSDISAIAADAKAEKKDPFENVSAPDSFKSVNNGNSANNNNNKNNNSNNNVNNNNISNNNNNLNKPNPAPAAPQQNKPAVGNKTSNFNFDMAELLKAAEEEAAKESSES